MPTRKAPVSAPFLFSKRTERKVRGLPGGGDRVLPVLLGLAAFFGLFFVSPFAADAHQYPKFLVFSVLTIAAGAWWMVLQVLRRERSIFVFPGGWEVILFISTIFLAFLFSKDYSLAFFGNPDQVGIPVLAMGAFVLFFFLAVQCFSSVAAVRRTVTCFLGCSVLALLFFLARAFLPISVFFPRMGLSLFAFIPSITGFFAVVTSVLACGMLLFASSGKKWEQALAWAAFAVADALVVLIGDRPAWAGLALGLAVLLFVRFRAGWRARPLPTAIATIMLLLALCASFFGTPTSFRLAVPAATSISSTETWQTTHRALSQDVRSFLFGTGFGTFPSTFARFRPASVNNSANFSVVASPASGALFGLLAEGGVVPMLGLILFLVMSGRSMVRSVRDAMQVLSGKTGREATGQGDAAAVLSLTAAFLAALVAGVAFAPTFSVVLTIVLLYAGLLVAATIAAGRPFRNVVPSRWMSLTGFPIGAIALVTLV
ncbi:hypothetical protein KBD18_02750, partial [Patescibacteria group bacterium]|nr:hypothetical protein [Patescibacteria group bacterium]